MSDPEYFVITANEELAKVETIEGFYNRENFMKYEKAMLARLIADSGCEPFERSEEFLELYFNVH